MIVHTYAVFLCNCLGPRLSNEDMNFVGAVLHGGGCDPSLLGEAHRRLPNRVCMIVYVYVNGIMYHADVIAGLELSLECSVLTRAGIGSLTSSNCKVHLH